MTGTPLATAAATMMTEPPIDETDGAALPLAEQVYGIVRDRIVSGHYAPGQQLSARRIADETGLGATPLREALARLQHDGLLVTLPRRGYVVSALTEKTVDDLFTVWQRIGPLIVALGVEHHDSETGGQIAVAVKRAIALASAGAPRSSPGPAAWIRLADERFRLLAHATGNPHLVSVNARLAVGLARLYTFLINHRAGAPADPVGPGRVAIDTAFLRFLEQRDGAAAAEATARSIAATRIALLEALREGASG